MYLYSEQVVYSENMNTPVGHWNFCFPVVEIATDINLIATTVPAKYNWYIAA